jgi:hypothetical protein
MIPVAIALSDSLSLLAASVLTGVPLISGGLWLWLGTLERKFYQGNPIPPRNLTK